MIPDAAIEAAARAVYQHVNRVHFEHGGWDAVAPKWQANYRREAKLVLEAAAPNLVRTITTADEIRDLPALTIVVFDDMATGGLLQTYVVPDDGTVMFKGCESFHLMTFAGDYVDAEDMPLPLTVVYEVTS
jgi:hypothetical protein